VRIIEVVHQTTYHYKSPVEQSWQLAHLRPRELSYQRVLEHRLSVQPTPDWIEQRVDSFGNASSAFALHGPHQTLDVTAVSKVAVWPRAADSDATRQPLECAQFLSASPQVPYVPAALRYARQSFRPGVPLNEALDDLARRIHSEFTFDASATTVTTPLQEVMATRRGVCQDFAHLMIAGLRPLGIPARYVSGYIVTTPLPGHARLIGADASHAWVSAWCPGQGWIDIDPTNNRRVDTDFVTLAWGRDFSDVSPLRGVILGGGEQALQAQVTVTPQD